MRLVSVALFAVLLPAIAAAQNSGVYIQAGPLADILFTSSPDGFPVEIRPLSDTSIGFPSLDIRRTKSRVAPGASAAIGVFITPSVSVRLEGSYQRERVTETES